MEDFRMSVYLSYLKAAVATLALSAVLHSCGTRGSMNPEAEVSQVAAPKGSFLELCRQSTAAA